MKKSFLCSSLARKSAVAFVFSMVFASPVIAHAESEKDSSIAVVKADSDAATTMQLPVSQKDKLIWETHEIARITAIQCHVQTPYNNFVNKWRSEIVASENRIMHDLSSRHIENIEGFLTDEDNKIAKNLNEYYGKNLCMMPDSITEETAAVPYDLEDIANFDMNYGHLEVLK